METVQYTPSLRIANVTELPACKGAKYLECLLAHNGELIAAQWRRKAPTELERGRVLVSF